MAAAKDVDCHRRDGTSSLFKNSILDLAQGAITKVGVGMADNVVCMGAFQKFIDNIKSRLGADGVLKIKAVNLEWLPSIYGAIPIEQFYSRKRSNRAQILVFVARIADLDRIDDYTDALEIFLLQSCSSGGITEVEVYTSYESQWD
jgi:hypothetical protein